VIRLVLGASLLLPGIALVLLGLFWLPFPPETVVGEPFLSPSFSHPMGTDWFGRDLLSRVMVGGRTSLAVSLLSVASGGALGILFGLFAGYFQGFWGGVLLRVSDGILAFPPVLLALILAVVLGRGLPGVTLALALFNFPYFFRLAHAGTLELREREYIVAARATGAGSGRILFRHLLPNLASPLLVQATFSLSTALLAEASLSYLGLGVQPPHPTWGRMLWEAQSWLFRSLWPALFPGLVLTFSVLGLNVLGDFLRDFLDPRLRPFLLYSFSASSKGRT
jgi:peptide/nickel transport system permease protein